MFCVWSSFEDISYIALVNSLTFCVMSVTLVEQLKYFFIVIYGFSDPKNFGIVQPTFWVATSFFCVCLCNLIIEDDNIEVIKNFIYRGSEGEEINDTARQEIRHRLLSGYCRHTKI